MHFLAVHRTERRHDGDDPGRDGILESRQVHGAEILVGDRRVAAVDATVGGTIRDEVLGRRTNRIERRVRTAVLTSGALWRRAKHFLLRRCCFSPDGALIANDVESATGVDVDCAALPS